MNPNNMDAKEIVNENFKGFDDLIEDIDLREFYKSLIVTCMEEYSQSQAQKTTRFCHSCGVPLSNDCPRCERLWES